MENDKDLTPQKESYYRGVITGWLMKTKKSFEEETGIEVKEVLKVLGVE